MLPSADSEFQDPTQVVTDAALEKKEPVALHPDAVSKAEMDGLKQTLAEKIGEIEGLKGKTAVLDRLAEVLGGRGASVDPKDAYVRRELERLAPELRSVRQIEALMPEILAVLKAGVDEKTEEHAETAQDHLKGLMKGSGLDSKDNEAVSYLEEAVVREIKSNKALLGLWARGNVKGAVDKAYEKVEQKLFAPIRANTKRSAVHTIMDSQKASPRGGAPSAGAGDKGKKLDFNDTSRDNRNAIHDAAFERLQELSER